MSQRGRGSGPDDDDPDGDPAELERPAGSYPVPPAASRPIAPYDPYRPSSGDQPRRSTRNIAAAPFEPPVRPSNDDPFLPADDPLSAEAWQLEPGEDHPGDDDAATLPEFDFETPPPHVQDRAPRRARRPPPSMRGSRETESSAKRPPRRGRTSTGGTRGRAARPAVAISMPAIVSGSSLVADQTALALVGLNAASIVVMALLLAMRIGGIPSPMVLQLDAAGNPDFWGAPGVLWRLPVTSLFITVMFLIVAWFLHPIDRFAARFALGAAFVMQVVAWVAVIQHLA